MLPETFGRGGVRCLPAHLYGAGSPARVLNTRPTIPGGGQVPGTPKNRVACGVDVPPPGARPRIGVPWNVSAESRWQRLTGVPRNVAMRARGGTKGSPSSEWCRLPFGVDPKKQRLQVLRPSGQAPIDVAPTPQRQTPHADFLSSFIFKCRSRSFNRRSMYGATD